MMEILDTVKYRNTSVPLSLFINEDNIRMYLEYVIKNLSQDDIRKLEENGIEIIGHLLKVETSRGEIEVSPEDDLSTLVFVFLKIYEALKEESPLVPSWEKVEINPSIPFLGNAFNSILQAYGWNTYDDPNMQETGLRVAKAWKEIFRGSFLKPPKVKRFDFSKMKFTGQSISDQGDSPSVFVGPIELKSTCSHHLLPIIGSVWVEYKPVNGQVIGLSKLPRLVQYLGARPMIQELYTKMIASKIHEITQAPVAVYVEAKHFCAYLRGVEDHSSKMITHWFIDYSDDDKTQFLEKVKIKGITQ